MNNFDVLVIPYRDLYFWNNYGSAVRDLQFLELILEHPKVNKVTVLNRPVSIYERVLNKKKQEFDYDNIDIIDVTSFDIIGPLKKRAWTVDCYKKTVEKFIFFHINNKNIPLLILDFTPFAIMPVIKSDKLIYWYDMIDNFTKHNCYSQNEKKLVKNKYKHVSENYNAITAVSEFALQEIPGILNSKVISNGVFESKFLKDDIILSKVYDFGFIGFVTDKFDLKFVCNLAEKYSVVVYGDIYDSEIKSILKKSGVIIKGKFKYNDIMSIVSTFKIGLLPYLEEKSHDGSPLKLYEYLKFNTPCITSMNYEYKNEYVINYNEEKDVSIIFDKLSKVSGDEKISSKLPDSIYLNFNLFSFIDGFL